MLAYIPAPWILWDIWYMLHALTIVNQINDSSIVSCREHKKKGNTWEHKKVVVLLDTVYWLFVFLQMFLHHVVLFLKIEGTITFHPSNLDIKRTVLLYPTLYMFNSLIYALKFPGNKNNTQYITRKPWLLKMFYQLYLPCFTLFYHIFQGFYSTCR